MNDTNWVALVGGMILGFAVTLTAIDRWWRK